jgi:hypothetical protein
VSASAPEPSKEVPGAALSTYLTANSAGGNATIKVEHQIPSSSGNFSYSFALSSPLAKESPYTEPATLDGLANGANLTATFGKFFTRPHDVDTPVWSLGGLARLGYTTFKFYDATSLAKGNAHKYSRTLGPYVGYSPAGAAPIFIVAKYEYQHSFKDTDSKVMCPESATFPVTCVSGPLGEPVENPKRLWSFSLRYSNPRFDLAPMLTYDRVSKAKGIDVPVYFIKASEDTNNTVPFNAGVRLGWRSDTKDYSLGVFVGTPFSFFTP